LAPARVLIALAVILTVALLEYLGVEWDAGLLESGATPAPPVVLVPTEVMPEEGEAEPPPAPVPVATQAGSARGEFDFYVLALSWSPDYCVSNGAGDAQQCGPGRKLGFVLHGLWPQYDTGHPSDCSNQKLPPEVEAAFPGLYPSRKLYAHEWEKHGTCSGLEPAEYLSLSRSLKEAVRIPDAYRAPEQPLRVTTRQLKADFEAANPGLGDSSLAAYCSGSGRFLKELFVCFSQDGRPVACSPEIHKKASRSCQKPDFLVRNVR
jgi:ribonuclease T2